MVEMIAFFGVAALLVAIGFAAGPMVARHSGPTHQ